MKKQSTEILQKQKQKIKQNENNNEMKYSKTKILWR